MLSRKVEEEVFPCSICGFNLPAIIKYDHLKCPVCELIESIKEHFSHVLKSVIVNYYAKYMFEIDTRSEYILEFGKFSFRQKRKHNLIITDELSKTFFSNFYMLIASHIEAIFYEIEKNIKDHEKNIYQKIDFKHLCSDEVIKDLFEKFKNGKVEVPKEFKEGTNLIRHVTNVLKHNGGIVLEHERHKSGSNLIKEFKFKEKTHLYDQRDYKIEAINNLKLTNYYQIACMMYIFFKKFVANLFSLPKLKEKELDIIKITNELVDLEIRDEVSKVLLPRLGDEGIFLTQISGVSNLSNDKLFKYLQKRVELLLALKKLGSKKIIEFETLGVLNVTNKMIKSIFNELNQIELQGLSLKPRNYKKKHPIAKSKMTKEIVNKFFSKLTKKHEENFVCRALLNEYSHLEKFRLSEFIIDYYSILLKFNRGEMALIIKALGVLPFRRWDPFLFNLNQPKI